MAWLSWLFRFGGGWPMAELVREREVRHEKMLKEE